jgi:arylsulfatase A-like enzyme
MLCATKRETDEKTMIQPTLLWTILSAALLGLAATVQAAPPPNKAPNILFLLSDDQRADTIAALGNTHIHTPHLDQLARDGAAFTRAYCMGAQQGAVCVPSRAMIMSGRTLFRVKENLAGQATWPEMFGQAGYTTFMSGKWHNGPESVLRSFQQGKALFLGGMGDPYMLPIQDITSDHRLTGKRDSGEHSVKLFADAAIEFIQRQKGEKPFLCYVAFNGPHDPRVAPKPFHDKYNADKPPAPPNFLPQHPFNNGAMAIRDEELAAWPRTVDIVRQHLADYYAYIDYLDDQVGRILDALRSSGQADNTIIVYSSDHGLALGSHGLFGKQNLYDHSMHSPLLLSGPGVAKGKKTDAMCYLLDIFPTLGDLTGVRGPEGSEGRSLAPIVAGKQEKHRDTIFTAFMKSQRAIRDDRWKLIVYPQINKTQLFDLHNDPAETRDLAGDPTQATEVKRLTALLLEAQKDASDAQPLSSDAPLPLEFDFSKVKRKHDGK